MWLSSQERSRINVQENAHIAVISSSETTTNPDPVKADHVDLWLNPSARRRLLNEEKKAMLNVFL